MKHWVLFAASFMLLELSHQLHTQVSKDEKNGRDWSAIPTHILELILSCLTRADFYQFGEVCTSWRHAFKQCILYKSPSHLPSMPLLLLIPSHKYNDKKIGLFSLIDKNIYFPKIPYLKENHLHWLGSIEGWLIMVDSNTTPSISSLPNSDLCQFPSFFFWNPISNERIMLPSKLTIPYRLSWYSLFRKVKASSRPNNPNCLVVALFIGQHNIAFCRPHDEFWNNIYVKYNDENEIFADIELFNGNCYVITESLTSRYITSILVYNLQDSFSSSSPPKAKILINQLEEKVANISPAFRNLTFQYHQVFFFLASDPTCGNLYLISMICDFNNSHPIEKEFIVYKVDNTSNVPQLERVMDLNGGILFLSHRDSKIIPSSTLNGPKDLIKGNSIYLAHYFPYKVDPPSMPQIVRFCMNSGRMDHIYLPNVDEDFVPTCLWFNPTLS